MKAIVEYFKNCPQLSGQSVREDYLDAASGSVAIVPDGGEQIIKKYASGDYLGQISFKIMVRENFTGKVSQLLESISNWIENQVVMPMLDLDRQAQYMEVSEGTRLVKTEAGAGIYEMKLRLVYYRKGDSI